MKTAEPTELGIVSTKDIQGYFNLFVAAPLPCVYILPILGHSNENTHLNQRQKEMKYISFCL